MSASSASDDRAKGFHVPHNALLLTLGCSCLLHRFVPQVHWFSIVNSLLIVLFLTAMIAMILIRNLHRDIMRYNRIPTDEEKAEEREETGWKVRAAVAWWWLVLFS